MKALVFLLAASGAAFGGSAMAAPADATVRKTPDRVLAAPAAPASASVPCASFISDLLAWVGADQTKRRIGAKMAAVKIKSRDGMVYSWGHGSYSEGGFGWHGTDLGGRFIVLFSDRRAGTQPFNRSASDIQDVTLYNDGRAQIMLRTWGNTILPLTDVACYGDGFLTGVSREGNGVSMVSFALRKEFITPDSHPSNWP